MKRCISLLLLLLVLSGCSLAGFDEYDGPASTTLVVALQAGQSKALPPFDASLRLTEASDDRCPLDVVCASAGTATVALVLNRSGRRPVSFTLLWPWAEGQGLDAEGFIYRDIQDLRVTLLKLRPHPDTRVPDPGPSTATLRVTRLR